MKTILKRLTIIMFLLGLHSLGYAQITVDKIDSLKDKTPQSTKLEQKTIDSGDKYDVLYQNQKEVNEKLLSLLTTSLTLIVGIIIAIIGTSIFYNYRFNKKEYELLTKENKNSLADIHTSLLSETNTSIEKMLTKLNQENDKKFEQINETYKTNYDTLRDSLKTIIQHFKEDYDNRISELKEKVESLEKENKEITESLESNLKLNEKQIRKDLLDVQGEIYKMKDWQSLALGTFVDQALLCIETGNAWQLEYVLTDILECLEKVISKKDTITPERKRNIETLISKLPDSYKSEREKIKGQYTLVPVKEIILAKRFFGGDSLTSIFESKK